jgi:hypothetical protein
LSADEIKDTARRVARGRAVGAVRGPVVVQHEGAVGPREQEPGVADGRGRRARRLGRRGFPHPLQ